MGTHKPFKPEFKRWDDCWRAAVDLLDGGALCGAQSGAGEAGHPSARRAFLACLALHAVMI